MTPLLLALALATQAPAQPPLPSDVPTRDTAIGNDLSVHDQRVSTPEARAAIQEYGTCAARNSPDLAAATLRADFTTQAYRLSLNRLSRANEGCFRRTGRMRSSGLLFAGAVAEAMVERAPTALNVRLAHAAQRPAITAFSPSDRIAICVVRSVPDDLGRLMASDVGSGAEQAAAQALEPAIRACAANAPPLRINTPGLRAILATATFRTVDTLAGTTAQAR